MDSLQHNAPPTPEASEAALGGAEQKGSSAKPPRLGLHMVFSDDVYNKLALKMSYVATLLEFVKSREYLVNEFDVKDIDNLAYLASELFRDVDDLVMKCGTMDLPVGSGATTRAERKSQAKAPAGGAQ